MELIIWAVIIGGLIWWWKKDPEQLKRASRKVAELLKVIVTAPVKWLGRRKKQKAPRQPAQKPKVRESASEVSSRSTVDAHGVRALIVEDPDFGWERKDTKSTLYVMDRNHKQIRSFVAGYKGKRSSSDEVDVFLGYGRVRPEPTNRYDRNAVYVDVRGKNIGYFSLRNLKIIRKWLTKHKKSTLWIRVVIKTDATESRVWFFDYDKDAPGFAQWLVDKTGADFHEF